MGFLVVKIIWATSCTGQGARNLISDIADEVDADDAYVVCSSSFLKNKWKMFVFLVTRLFIFETHIVINFNDLPSLFLDAKFYFFII